MKRIICAVGLIAASIVFSGCSSSTSSQSSAPSSDATTTQKSGDTTKTGKITEAGSKFFLQEAGKQPIEIDSYGIELKSYVGQTVTVTGQYSGDTLFVSMVK
jgi:hypothetical protein